MAIEKLSAPRVGRISKPGKYGDGGGLYLQVTRTLVKSWIFRYEVNGSERYMGLGPLHTVDLKQAREEARKARTCLARKADPLQERARIAVENTERIEFSGRKTFDECATEYIAHHKNGWKSAKHLKQWESSLKTYASPYIGKRFVHEINTALVLQMLKPIWFKKTKTASRLRERIERVLSWATICRHRTGDNPARWNGHLQEILPKPSRIKIVKHHPSMPCQEIRAFFEKLDTRESLGARALAFTILTACRTSEALHAKWQEIDFARRIWTIPAEKMKNGKTHRVPLADAALRILHTLEGSHPVWVFPSPRRNRNGPIYEGAMFDLLRKMNRPDITVHGFRSTFRVWAAEKTSYAREIVEMALAHKLASAVERAYQRSDLFELRRVLMQDWARWCVDSPSPRPIPGQEVDPEAATKDGIS
ncbi:MAG: tyrosine-type recombinase/integrase [Azoarcus sp.]|nr:tyrosine-type recombinase/integrase [Azoarcus sp.]